MYRTHIPGNTPPPLMAMKSSAGSSNTCKQQIDQQIDQQSLWDCVLHTTAIIPFVYQHRVMNYLKFNTKNPNKSLQN